MAIKKLKYGHSFTTALDNDSRKDKKWKITHAVFDFDGLEEEVLHDLAVKQATIAYQRRMRNRWEEHSDVEEVTIKVRDLLTRQPGGPRKVTMDSAAEFVASLSDEEREAFMEKVGLKK